MSHFDNKFKKCMLERFLVPDRGQDEQLDELFRRVYFWVMEYADGTGLSEDEFVNKLDYLYKEFMWVFTQKKYLTKNALVKIPETKRNTYKYFIEKLQTPLYFKQYDYTNPDVPCDIDMVAFYDNHFYELLARVDDKEIDIGWLVFLQTLMISYKLRSTTDLSKRRMDYVLKADEIVRGSRAILNNKHEEGETRTAFTQQYRGIGAKTVVWKHLLRCIPSNFVDPLHDDKEIVNKFLEEAFETVKSWLYSSNENEMKVVGNEQDAHDFALSIMEMYSVFFELVHLQDNMKLFMERISGEYHEYYYRIFKSLKKVAYINNVYPNFCNFNMGSIFDNIIEVWDRVMKGKKKIKRETIIEILFSVVLFHSWVLKQEINVDEMTDVESDENEEKEEFILEEPVEDYFLKAPQTQKGKINEEARNKKISQYKYRLEQLKNKFEHNKTEKGEIEKQIQRLRDITDENYHLQIKRTTRFLKKYDKKIESIYADDLNQQLPNIVAQKSPKLKQLFSKRKRNIDDLLEPAYKRLKDDIADKRKETLNKLKQKVQYIKDTNEQNLQIQKPTNTLLNYLDDALKKVSSLENSEFEYIRRQVDSELYKFENN